MCAQQCILTKARRRTLAVNMRQNKGRPVFYATVEREASTVPLPSSFFPINLEFPAPWALRPDRRAPDRRAMDKAAAFPYTSADFESGTRAPLLDPRDRRATEGNPCAFPAISCRR